MPQVHGDVRPGHERPEPRLVRPPLANETCFRQPDPLQPALEVEARRRRSDEQERHVRMLRTHRRRSVQELGNALARVHDAEAADHRACRNPHRLHLPHRPGGVRHQPHWPCEPGSSDEVENGARVDDETRRMLQDEGRERKVGRTRFPERGYPLVEDAVREQAADDAVLVLHRVEVGVSVATADGHPRHEVVKHEVVEDDDTGLSAERIDDPGVCIRVVSDVVERHVRSPGALLRPRLTTVTSSRSPRAGRRSAL